MTSGDFERDTVRLDVQSAGACRQPYGGAGKGLLVALAFSTKANAALALWPPFIALWPPFIALWPPFIALWPPFIALYPAGSAKINDKC